MINMLKKHLLVISIITGVILAVVSCSERLPDKATDKSEITEEESAVVTFVIGNVKIKRKGDLLNAKARDILRDGDIIVTSDKSYMAVQLRDIIFRIEANSDAELTSIRGYGQNEFYLKNGLILSKLSKLKRGEKYVINTPTIVAAVRGTVFLTEHKSGISNVAVSRGIVSVRHNASGYEKLTEAGTSSVVDENIRNRGIDPVEKLTLTKIEDTPLIQDLNSLNENELMEKNSELKENDDMIDKEIDKLIKSKMSLDEVKSKFGRIDVVTLYNGKVYKGAILSRGTTIKMVTPTGIVYINKKNIKQTQSL